VVPSDGIAEPEPLALLGGLTVALVGELLDPVLELVLAFVL
jgi:hypothetical protein